jgi:hypothetical protein
MYVLPSRKKFRRRTRLEAANYQARQINDRIAGLINVLAVYGDPKNWHPTDETKDVRNEAGLVVGVERIHTWRGPGPGPDLAVHALKKVLNVEVKHPKPKQEAE